MKYAWTCPSCGLPHIFATCWDALPAAEWVTATRDDLAAAYLRSMQQSLTARRRP